MPKLTISLVGMHFRPPAKQLISVMPAGARLQLVPEPDNPYDPKAVQVWGSVREIPPGQYDVLESALVGTGHDIREVREQNDFHLGYLADSDGKVTRGKPGNREAAVLAGGVGWSGVQARLGFNPDGKPTVELESME